MPIRFGAIQKKTLPFAFDYEVDGATEKVTGVFRPNTFSPELAEQETGLTDEEKAGRIARSLTDTLVSWDVQTDDGRPYPLDADSLKKFGYHFLNATFMGLIESLKPGEPNASSLGNGSSPGEASGDAQSGTTIGY